MWNNGSISKLQLDPLAFFSRMVLQLICFIGRLYANRCSFLLSCMQCIRIRCVLRLYYFQKLNVNAYKLSKFHPNAKNRLVINSRRFRMFFVYLCELEKFAIFPSKYAVCRPQNKNWREIVIMTDITGDFPLSRKMDCGNYDSPARHDLLYNWGYNT